MSDIQLRPYQRQFIDDARAAFRKHRHIVGVAPCGAGKTIMTGWMIKESLKNGKRTIFFVHRDELIGQTARTFVDLDIPFGIIASGVPSRLDLPVQIASVQTLARRLEKIPAPNFLICDECHHILANTYKKVLKAFPKAYLLGVTATPRRMGGVNLGDVFEDMVESLSVRELINLGNLTEFKYYAPDIGVRLAGVQIKRGDYDNRELEAAMSGGKIIGGIVENYQRLANGKQAICYCVNVHHSKSVAEAFNNAGISAAHVDGETPAKIRAYLVDQFRHGKIKILCNAELFGEGFDVPKCQAVILARPTQSLTLHIQQSMRSMRPDPDDPNKVAIIIDHVQNYVRHGKPDTPLYWSLDKNADPKVRLTKCPKCTKKITPYQKDGRRICPNCGYVFPKLETEQGGNIERDTFEYDGKLVEIPSSTQMTDKLIELFAEGRKRRRAIGWVANNALEFATSYNDCLVIAQACGYKPGWAYYHWPPPKKSSLDS